MKKSAAFFALLALCLLPLGCNRFEESPVPEQVSNQLDAEAPASSWDEDVILFDPAGFTQAQMLEDYDYFWDTILANCPLMAAYPQQMGQTVEEAWLQYRQRFEELADGDGEGFSTAIGYTGNMAFKGFGHIGGMPATQYYLTMNNQELADPEILRMIDNPRAASYYKWEMSLPAYQAMAGQTKKIEDISPEEAEKEFQEFLLHNIQTGTYGEAAYLAVRSFSPPLGTEQLAIEQIQDFCRQNLDAKHIIIDIRGNGGGSDTLWMEGFQPLLAGKEWGWQTIAGFKDTPLNRDNWGDWPQKDDSIQLFSIDQLEQVEQVDFSGADPEHLQAMDGVMVKTDVIKGGQGPVFQGKVWLLVNFSNYSAAESFVQFAQRSGFATLVGEQTRGNGGAVRYTPYNFFSLPNSGRMVRFVPFYYFNTNGTCNSLEGTRPDIDAGNEDALAVCLREIGR